MSGERGWETPAQPRRGRGLTAVAAAAALVALAVAALAGGDRAGLEVTEASPTEASPDGEPPPASPIPARTTTPEPTAAATPEPAPAPVEHPEEPAGSWREIAAAPIGGRTGALAAWTGSEVVVWGGATAEGEMLTDGAAYDPAADRWREIAGAPRPAATAYEQAAVWTGTEMVVLGPDPPLAYDPAADTWRDLPPPPEHASEGGWFWWSARWVSGHVVVLGGAADAGGELAVAAIDPRDGAWVDLPAPPVDGWTGPVRTAVAADRLLVFGLVDSRWSPRLGVTAYDLDERAWTAPDPGPGGGWFPQLVAGLGSERIVGVGASDGGAGVAHAWSPHAAWHAFPDPPAWLVRLGVPPEGFWTGDAVLVWTGAASRSGALLREARPGRGWQQIAQAPLAGRSGHVATWTGTELVVWGGASEGGRIFGDGAAFDPAGPAPWLAEAPGEVARLDGAWRRLADTPFTRDNPSLDWTGRELLLWGGTEGRHASSGSAYDPARDTWEALPDAPVAGRQNHLGVWTGWELLVWGGHDLGGRTDGAAYDPRAGTWRELPEAPLDASERAVGAWTGTEVLVVAGGAEATAAAYDPRADRWRRLPDPPPHGHRHGAVWTGAELLVVSDALDGTLVAFDPADGVWRGLADVTEPLPSDGVEVAWTGEEVLLWGGMVEAASRAGWAYHPGSNTWRRLPEAWLGGTINAAGSVWTGEHWVVLGSDAEGRPGLAAYDPAGDRWLALPPPRSDTLLTGPLAWTGSELVVWSMFGEALAFRPGG